MMARRSSNEMNADFIALMVNRCRSLQPQAKGPTGILVDVVDDPHAVAEPIGTAECDGLMDGRQPERLAGVNGEAGVVASHVLERIEMPRRRVSGLGARDVETDHTLVSEPDGQLGDLAGPRSVPHRRGQASHGD